MFLIEDSYILFFKSFKIMFYCFLFDNIKNCFYLIIYGFRNGLKKLRAKAKYEERTSEPYALSAMIKKPKLRSMTYTNEQNMAKHPPSPSIFKRQNNEHLSIVVIPCDSNINLRDKMNCSIRNFIAKPQKELAKTNSNSSEKAFEETTNLRNKMLTKHNKIKNNETIISLLTKIRNISMEVSKTQFTPSFLFFQKKKL